jgi:dTDP-4-dehydrorhamnose 3,5-epimerase
LQIAHGWGKYHGFADERPTKLTDDLMPTRKPDSQTVDRDWNIIGQPRIEGVACKEIRPVTTGKGTLTEVWRVEWALDRLAVGQVFQSLLDPGKVSDWHAHAETTDRLFCAMGRIRLALYDGRLKTLRTAPSLTLNRVDRAYSYENPDHWRLPPDTPDIPFSLL